MEPRWYRYVILIYNVTTELLIDVELKHSVQWRSAEPL